MCHHLQNLFMPFYVFLCFSINFSFSTSWVSFCVFLLPLSFLTLPFPVSYLYFCLIFFIFFFPSLPSLSLSLNIISPHLSVPLSPSLSIWGQEDSGHVTEDPLNASSDPHPGPGALGAERGQGSGPRGPRRYLHRLLSTARCG